jgi:Bacteriophage replication protein O
MANDRTWEGFSLPTYTQVPDEFFDDLMVDLSESELRVLLYLIRRTFGFKKTSDAISLKQIISGIQTKDGRVIDRGAGLSHTSVKRGIKGLVERGVVRVDKVRSESGDYETNIYEIVFKGAPQVGTQVAPGRHAKFLPVGNPVAEGVGTRSSLQETVEQHTALQQTAVEDSNGHHSLLMISVNDRLTIERYVKDFARELNDQAPLISSVTRACRLYVESGLALDVFAERMIEARRRTQQHSGGIRTEPTPGRTTKPKIAYWFGTLERLVGAKT